MTRPITLFIGQWADLPLAELAPLARTMGYDGLELACGGDHFHVQQAPASPDHVHDRRALLARHGLQGKGDGSVGVFGGHTGFGDARRSRDFRSVGRGMIDFGSRIVALDDVGDAGPLSVEWEGSRMDRVHGATESAACCRRLDFEPATGAFDAVFDRSRQGGMAGSAP